MPTDTWEHDPHEVADAVDKIADVLGDHKDYQRETWLIVAAQMLRDLHEQNAELRAENERLRSCDYLLMQELCYLYWSAYNAGHSDTISGHYTDVVPADRYDYHEDAVKECLEGGDMPTLFLALAAPGHYQDTDSDGGAS